jgi:serine protein kinase
MQDESGARGRIEQLATAVAQDFESTRRVLSFEEWFDLLCQAPHVHARNAAQYMRDCFDFYGKRDVRIPSGKVSRFRLFDCEFDAEGPTTARLVGQELAQNAFFEAIDGFVRIGRVNKLLLLHGPNGSAKTTFLDAVMRALEAYSQTDGGALYRFSWVFPNKTARSGGIGFGSSPWDDEAPETTYARLSAEAVDAKLSDENKDPPVYLLPLAMREQVLVDILANARQRAASDASGQALREFNISELVLHGDLTQRNRRIFDALLGSYQGDLRKVYQHIQVERLFLSRHYRAGLVTVEPKQTVDARSFPVTGERAYSSLPPGVGGQVLYATQGDLVDANRGMINFSDLLKRPYEHYKYLLTTTESGVVALDHVVLALDMVFAASGNDLNLLEFRALRSGEYQSLRGRLELIPVPYLLDYRVERKVYQEQVGDVLRGIHIAPHVPRILALWGVMTRLRPPNAGDYSPKLQPVLSRLTPLDKADLYAYGRVPPGLTSDEARELLAAVPAMHQERFQQAMVKAESGDPILLGDYEGSFGASVRDLKRVLLAAASDPGTRCVTVPRIFKELRKFMADSVNHRWMLLAKAGAGFHGLDGEGSISQAVWNRWLDLSDWEVREAMGLVDESRYLELFKKYVKHVSHHLKRERLFDPVTGDLRDPDEKFMQGLEKTMDPKAGPQFRADVLSRVGAWALSHPDEEPAYAEIFADYFGRLREDYYRQQKASVGRGIQRMLELLSDDPRTKNPLAPQEEQVARHAVDVLLGACDDQKARKERHTRETLRDTLVQLSKFRY